MDFMEHPNNQVYKEEIKTDKRLYYLKLSSMKFVVGLPGFGYDCFRYN